MCERIVNEKKVEEKKDMSTVSKPVESLEIEFNSDEEYENFTELVNNPPEPSDFLKKLIKDYQDKRNKNHER